VFAESATFLATRYDDRLIAVLQEAVSLADAMPTVFRDVQCDANTGFGKGVD
jgi:hypothetical protein